MSEQGRRGLSAQEQSAILDQNLVAMASRGARVLTRSGGQAVVVMGKPVNHVLHLLLSLFCCGWWVPVWLFITALGGEKRTTITVESTGQVHEQKAPMEAYRIALLVIAGIWLLGWMVFFGSFISAFGSH
jgi:hypothetical protein